MFVSRLKLQSCPPGNFKMGKTKLDATSSGNPEKLTFLCDWNECGFQNTDEDVFYRHVTSHIEQLKVVPAEDDDSEMYECSWRNCSHSSDNSKEIVPHVKYHGYLAILKAKGIAVATKRKLPPCNYPDNESSALQPWSKSLVCLWDDCSVKFEFSGLREFIIHVQTHVLETSGGPTPLRCGWSDCSFSTPSDKYRLTDHVKVHTGARAIACVCGNTFANVTKFVDHCIRQKTSIDEGSFKCGYCFTYLPSERIFKDHMRQHVNHYKCNFCDLTCNCPSVLTQHIRYKHLPYKPFKCSSCDYASKSAYDLKMHLKTHTKDVSYFTCNEENCNFRCARQAAFMRHLYQVHGDGSNKNGGFFVCHICEKKYARGTGLTKHLRDAHKVLKPAGHSRFIYRHEGDGCFRLRTVRLESLQVMESSESDVQLTDPGKVRRSSVDAGLSLTDEENVDDPLAVADAPRTIIDVLDEKGEVISSLTETVNFENLPPNAKIVAVGSSSPCTVSHEG